MPHLCYRSTLEAESECIKDCGLCSFSHRTSSMEWRLSLEVINGVGTNLPLSDLSFGKGIVKEPKQPLSRKFVRETRHVEWSGAGEWCWLLTLRFYDSTPDSPSLELPGCTRALTHTLTPLTLMVFSLAMLPPGGNCMPLISDIQLCSQYSWEFFVWDRIKPSVS